MHTDALYQLALQHQSDLRADAERGRVARLFRRVLRRPEPRPVPATRPRYS